MHGWHVTDAGTQQSTLTGGRRNKTATPRAVPAHRTDSFDQKQSAKVCGGGAAVSASLPMVWAILTT